MTGFYPGVRSSLVRLWQRLGCQALLLQGRREGRDAAEGDGGGPHGYRGRARVKGQNKSGLGLLPSVDLVIVIYAFKL